MIRCRQIYKARQKFLMFKSYTSFKQANLMVKKIFKLFLVFLLLFVAFSFWMSPRLGGIIPWGKDEIDRDVEVLKFDTLNSGNFNLTYPDLTSKSSMKDLRAEFKLDSIISECKTEFEKVVKIQSWVQSRWRHDGDNIPEHNDATYILKEAQKGRRFRCVEYSIVAGQCLSALGFKIRSLGLMTKDIDDVKSGAGHVVNEVYLRDLRKWVLIDPQFDVITVIDSLPLNAVELQNCIAKLKDFEILNPNKTTTKEEYKKWIGPYLYYFKVGINGQRVSIWDRIAGNKKELTLLPIGAIEPTYFQKIFRIRTSYYTNSIGDFYPILGE